MFYRTQALFPIVPTEEQKKIQWQGKFLRIHWNDGSFTDFKAQSLDHWLALLRFYYMENQQAGNKKRDGKNAV